MARTDPDRPDLLERFVETIVITESIWALSRRRHGRITDQIAARA